jgi:hypothetical protein
MTKRTMYEEISQGFREMRQDRENKPMKKKDRIRKLRTALDEIAALTSHRSICCPTNEPKSIARAALKADKENMGSK